MAHEDLHLNLRNLTLEDYSQLQELMDDVYDDIGGAWPKEPFKELLGRFPAGQIGLEEAGNWVALQRTSCGNTGRCGIRQHSTVLFFGMENFCNTRTATPL